MTLTSRRASAALINRSACLVAPTITTLGTSLPLARQPLTVDHHMTWRAWVVTRARAAKTTTAVATPGADPTRNDRKTPQAPAATNARESLARCRASFSLRPKR